jgi:hypothetical protein
MATDGRGDARVWLPWIRVTRVVQCILGSLLAAIALLYLAPSIVEGQSAHGIPRIGYVFLGTKAATLASTNVFVDSLRQHGYTESRSVFIDWRFADDQEERL